MRNVFKDQKVVVAGGSSGIGLAAARLFNAANARVTITARDQAKLARVKEEGFQTTSVDSRDRQALENFFSEHGPLHHLVISLSGSKGIGMFSELSLATLKEGFDEKFWPVLHTLQAASPYIADNGSVTLVTAISGIAKLPGTSGLGAINGGLEIMVQVIAKEMKRIRVNAVSPGVVDTEWWHFLDQATRDEQFKKLTGDIQAKRPATPDEIADAILFAAGNPYVTGKIIACDGGLS